MLFWRVIALYPRRFVFLLSFYFWYGLDSVIYVIRILLLICLKEFVGVADFVLILFLPGDVDTLFVCLALG